MAKTLALFIPILIFSLIIYSLRVWFTGQGVFGDANAYYSYAHALIFNRSLDFTLIYHHLSNFSGPNFTFSRVFWTQTPTVTGMLPNQWLIGPALHWLPLMAAVYLLTLPLSFDPYSVIWEYLSGISGLIFGILGLLILYRLLTKLFSAPTSFLTVLTLFWTTNLVYYLSFEPGHSHSIIFFLNSLLLSLVFARSRLTTRTSIYIGLIYGLATITRPSGFLIGILLIPLFLSSKPVHRLTLILATGFGVLPQLLVQLILFGNPFSQPYITGYHGAPTFNFDHILPALISARRGLFFWTPTLLLALWGIFKSRHHKPNRILIVYLLTHLIFVGSWNGVLSAGFSNRFFIEVFPILAIFLATALSRFNTKTIAIIFVFGLYFNFALLTQFFLDEPRLVDQSSITHLNVLTGQITYPLELLSQLTSHGFVQTVKTSILRH